jgi:O-antigen ligase
MSKKELILFSLVGLLFAIWPVPHTMSVREVLLFGGFCTATFFCYRDRSASVLVWLRGVRVPAIFIVALTVWIFAVALFVSPEPAWSLGEVTGQWLKGIAALVLGGLVAATFSSNENSARRLFLVLSGILLLQIVAICVEGAYTGEYERADGLTGGADKASYLTNIMIAILFGELLVRLTQARRLLPVPTWLISVASILTILSLYAERVRNGVGTVAVMFLCWAALYLAWVLRCRGSAQRRMFPAAIVSVAVLAFLLMAVAGSAKPGSSWSQFGATIPIALDTQAHKGWINEHKYGLPSLPDGTHVDESAYMRIAWFKEGLTLSSEHPLGVGFGRNAFGHAVSAKYEEFKGHSHSSFIDLLVGIGIPGVMLWLGFFVSLLWFAYRGASGGWGYALFFIVLDFGVRMFVDSNVRDHMLQMFMFLVGVLTVLTARSLVSPTAVQSTK